jgi:hypothetical protein
MFNLFLSSIEKILVIEWTTVVPLSGNENTNRKPRTTMVDVG